MPFPANPDLVNPADSSTLRQLYTVSSDFDRSILGIPAEDDEFTRGLIFSFDPSTGLPSVPSTSQESADLVEDPPYEPSRSSNNTGSLKIFTPQSVSDAQGGLHPRSVSSRSVGSSDAGSSVHEADSSQDLPISAQISAGTNEIATSPNLIQTPTYLPMVGTHTPSTMPPADDLSYSEHCGPWEDINDPREVIDIGPNDIKYLAEILRREDPSRLGDPAQALDPMDLMDDETRQSTTSLQSELARGLNSNHGEIHKSIGTHTRAVSNGKERVSQLRHNTKSRRAIEKVKLMRQIGACLPCLVNHEQVSA